MRTFTFKLAMLAGLVVFGLPSASLALASMGIRFISITGDACSADAGRNTGNIVLGRAEGIGFGASNSVCATPGDTIFGQILISVDDDGTPGNTDDDGLVAFTYSMLFDTQSGTPIDANGDFGNLQNELNLVAANELNSVTQGAQTLSPLNSGITSTQESTLGGVRGEALEFEGSTLGTGLNSGGNPYVVGNFTMFVTGNAISDGRDIFAGFFTANDSFLFNSLTLQTVVGVVGGDVNSLVFVPEPGTAALLGLGLLGAVGLARRGSLRKR